MTSIQFNQGFASVRRILIAGTFVQQFNVLACKGTVYPYNAHLID